MDDAKRDANRAISSLQVEWLVATPLLAAAQKFWPLVSFSSYLLVPESGMGISLKRLHRTRCPEIKVFGNWSLNTLPISSFLLIHDNIMH